MATPTRDAIHTFMSITGASEFVSVRKLEEFGGNLNEAVNSYMREGDRHIFPAADPRYYPGEMNNHNQVGSRGLLPLLSAARRFRPSLLLDPNYRREIYNRLGASASNSHSPHGSHPAMVRGVPLESSGPFEQFHHVGLSPTNENMTGNSSSHGREINDMHTSDGYGNDIEEEMIQAAIRASKQENREHYLSRQYSALDDSSAIGTPQDQLQQEDDDLALALSLSLKPGNSSNQIGAKNASQPLVTHQLTSDTGNHFEEWGGISSEELNEALLLENALFGEIYEKTSKDFSSTPHIQGGPEKTDRPLQPSSSPLSTSLTAARLLREQQNKEYLASLLADREKEANTLQEAEAHCSKKEKSGKMLEREELKRIPAAKEDLLPKEPPLDDENSVNVAIRMPDGSRLGRCFLKSNKLQLLFDFIDLGGAVNPGTYRVVRSYPRRAYSVDDGSLTLGEIVLASKQEAFFLELI
ncbi:Plant UBX domain-containing protein 8 [Quillaja saponaria]|uniref:Plant UBX domain-containing protein 8 n=1 Tax=Quillaja saponaria TaxID=32244 RepID=A0AAD7LQ67_QUISA|nr:Plant UBX domain-containing protein 8 [Quillaja saponaria]